MNLTRRLEDNSITENNQELKYLLKLKQQGTTSLALHLFDDIPHLIKMFTENH